jgi:hypothetical protein
MTNDYRGPLYRHFNSGCISLVLAMVSTSALATTELVLQLDSSWRYESNPFRFPDDANVMAAIGRDRRGDQVLANDIRAGVIIPLDSPQTSLILTGQLGRRNYDQLTQLDNTEYAYRASLEWRLGSLWRGDVTHRDEQMLFNYLNGGLTSREMVRVGTDTAVVALRVTPDIDLPLTLRNRRTSYESAQNWSYDNDERIVDLGVRYAPTTRSMVTGGLRSTSVKYHRRDAAQSALLDTGFSDAELYVDADWRYSSFTRVVGRFAAQKRSFDHLGEKNFTVFTTYLNVLYQYSPLTRVSLELWNRPFGAIEPNALYSISTGGQLSARWQATPKTRVDAVLTKERNTYEFVANAAGLTSPRTDRGRVGGAVVYALAPSVRVYAEGFRERQDRGALGAPISFNSLRVGLEYTYENLTDTAVRAGFGSRRANL